MNLIAKRTNADMVALFGDYDPVKLEVEAKSVKYVKKCFGAVSKSTPILYMNGNHDDMDQDSSYSVQEKQFEIIGSDNVGYVNDPLNPFGNYGYRDFNDRKIRVVYVNSIDLNAEGKSGGCYISAKQMKWLVACALDLSDKEEGWGVIVFSHHPLNWYQTMQGFSNVLGDYKHKKSGSVTIDGTTISYDFRKQKAELIAHFHGHLHNFRAETINDVLTVTIPNATFGRNNEYGLKESATEETRLAFGDIADGKQRRFEKTKDSDKDTAFNVVVIDRENRRIYCYCYGAGIDRVFEY